MISIRVGVEWVEIYRLSSQPCKPESDLHYSGHVAWSFLAAMGSFGHHEIFNWGNDDAWSSDFDHPDFGGDSLNWSDNVHFCYFGGHGGHIGWKIDPTHSKRIQALAFSSNHTPPDYAPCMSLSVQWRLGINRLKWFLIDSCKMVANTDPNHIVEVWAEPMQGIHLLLGFIDIQWVGADTYNRRVAFAFDICRGRSLANAWLDTAFHWDHHSNQITRPIAIAAGATRDEAINRREYETLDWAPFNVTSTSWLAWKWRG
jgi:hypothetical protein